MKVRGIWDPSQVQNKVHFRPTRGPEQIKFPMSAKKALMRLTGRPTLARAKIAYLHYTVARYVGEGWNKKDARAKAKIELRNNLDGPWKWDFFEFHAEEYVKWPRPNFDAAANKRRLSKILSRSDSKKARS